MIVHIVAHDLNQAIGGDNQLLWHLPGDFKHDGVDVYSNIDDALILVMVMFLLLVVVRYTDKQCT